MDMGELLENMESGWSCPTCIPLKPCYMSYLDHCLLLGHFQMAMLVLDSGGWTS